MIIAKFYRTDLVICSHFREGETSIYSHINMVNIMIMEIHRFSSLTRVTCHTTFCRFSFHNLHSIAFCTNSLGEQYPADHNCLEFCESFLFQSFVGYIFAANLYFPYLPVNKLGLIVQSIFSLRSLLGSQLIVLCLLYPNALIFFV